MERKSTLLTTILEYFLSTYIQKHKTPKLFMICYLHVILVRAGYQQDGLLKDKSPTKDSYGGYNSSDNFQGFGEETKP